MSNGKCLMGHKVSYVRRKQFSQCFNPEVTSHSQHEPQEFQLVLAGV
jgi:hypothetical protein